MTLQNIANQFNGYSKEYDIPKLLSKIQDTVYDYEIEIGNIVCVFVYNKVDHLEISLMTCPNKNIPRIIINKK